METVATAVEEAFQDGMIDELRRAHARDGLSAEVIRVFSTVIHGHAATRFRRLPWRETVDPYRILVSEIMLQQTQVERVVEKYRAFIARFPDFATLADAPLADLLAAWQGLGYNRRAINLQSAARQAVDQWEGILPPDPALLATLPGIGRYTAAAVCVFAFNMPVALIETNIRAVYIHCFFGDREKIADRELLPLVEATLDREEPRLWFNALMDYGSELKRAAANPARRSAHHSRQSAFQGSNRQVRGMLLKQLLAEGPASCEELSSILQRPIDQVSSALGQMAAEGFVREDGPLWQITPG